jgi:hypothetical protein
VRFCRLNNSSNKLVRHVDIPLTRSMIINTVRMFLQGPPVPPMIRGGSASSGSGPAAAWGMGPSSAQGSQQQQPSQGLAQAPLPNKPATDPAAGNAPPGPVEAPLPQKQQQATPSVDSTASVVGPGPVTAS